MGFVCETSPVLTVLFHTSYISLSTALVFFVLLAIACGCNAAGSTSTICNSTNGQCSCHPNVVGRTCDQCLPDHFGLTLAPDGCEPCACNATGSTSSTCDINNGSCTCQPYIINRQCDACAPDTFGFSSTGCTRKQRPCKLR